MLNKRTGYQDKFICTTLEQLMPDNHFLRKVDKYIDFSFIYDMVEHLYSNTGRKSIDPVVIVKMLLIGFLYNIDSERKLEKEIQVNIAYRWFLGINLDEDVPDHSTVSQLRRRQFKGTCIFEKLFDHIVHQCIANGLVEGVTILTDSTHIKAHADNSETIVTEKTTDEYIKELNSDCEPKTKRSSKTDPDCGWMSRVGKPKGFYYLCHESCDAKHGIITDVHVTPGNVLDFVPYIDRIKYQKDKFGFSIENVGADKGYDYSRVHSALYDLGIKTYMPLRDTEKATKNKVFPPSKFEFNTSDDCYICPAGKKLEFAQIRKDRDGKVYKTSTEDCVDCPLRTQCINNKSKYRTIYRPARSTETEIQRRNYSTDKYYEIQKKRRIFCEGNFALQKDNHNLRRLLKTGNANVTIHCLFSAMALNIKRFIKYINKPSARQSNRAILINICLFVIFKRKNAGSKHQHFSFEPFLCSLSTRP